MSQTTVQIENINLTIDDQPLSVPKGTSVISAIKEFVKGDIPHFCWHPGLSVAGVCRFCMVKIEGMPKLQIACNTQCTEGMKVYTKTAEVKEAHKWALEFHLINHPLDCPICDQAGECELQNYYMKVGKYDAQMDENKVLKPKALDVGRELVLDTERCILCSRCVRFEDEVTKTNGLGIFNRGDHSVIGTFHDRKIEHNYSYNLVDICPVGAFTSKDFRFKCRVWFLSETPTICPGCSTGCNITLFHKKKEGRYYRVKPRKNLEVNGHWMCDAGRFTYEHLNPENRLSKALCKGSPLDQWEQVEAQLVRHFHAFKAGTPIAVVLTPQYTNEEYAAILDTLQHVVGQAQVKVFIWRDAQENVESFDGLLYRGDHNPNTKGLQDVCTRYNIQPVVLKDDFSALAGIETCVLFGPEMENTYTDFVGCLNKLTQGKKVIYFGNHTGPTIHHFDLAVPVRTFAEKNGTFVNVQGFAQRLKANPPLILGLPTLEDLLKRVELQVSENQGVAV